MKYDRCSKTIEKDSVYRHEGAARRAIHAMKYEGCPQIALLLAAAVVRFLPQPDAADMLCAVPLHDSRQRQRGYNQSDLLARELARYWSVSCLPSEALQRIRDTDSQVGLDYAARRENVIGAFAARRFLVQNRNVILVDDVCTTGSTLDACAVALLDSGASSVTGVTVARAVGDW